MIRVIITQVVLFCLPFLAFFVYKVATTGWTGARLASTRWVTFGLITAGFALVLASFVYLAVTGTTNQGLYVPAQYKDGVLIPGGFRPRE